MSGEAGSAFDKLIFKTESFRESVINWFKSNETTDLFEVGQLPKHELDERTNATYTLTEAKIKHGSLVIDIGDFRSDSSLSDLEDISIPTRWEDFERIEDKEGFLAKLKDHKPSNSYYDDVACFKGEVMLNAPRVGEIAKWELSFFLRDNGAEDSVVFHENYPRSPIYPSMLSEKFIRKKFVMTILKDDLGLISDDESDLSEYEGDDESEEEEEPKRRKVEDVDDKEDD